MAGTSENTQELLDLLSKPELRHLFKAYDDVSSHDYDFLEESLPAIPFEVDDDDVAIKVVQLVKGSEPLGATIKVDHDTGAVIIARIIAGGAADRCGSIKIGDQILEVNGVNVVHRQPTEIINLLNVAENDMIVFKLIPAQTIVEKQPPILRYVRCMTNYSFEFDPMHPCPEAAMNFKKGDILKFIVSDDHNFIQAKRIGHGSLCCIDDDKNDDGMNRTETLMDSVGLVPCSSFLKKLSNELIKNQNIITSETDPYEAVGKLAPSSELIRPIILIGPPGVGRNELKRRLIMHHPKKYASTVPHTSRPRRPQERDGIDYYFASRKEMENWIRDGRFIEFGEYNGNLYGTLDEAITNLIEKKKVPVLNAHPLALKMLRNSTFKPIIILVEPPDFESLKETRSKMNAKSALSGKEFTEKDFEQMLQQAEQLDKCYGPFFDARVTNNDLVESSKILLSIIKSFETHPSWVPKEWIEPNES